MTESSERVARFAALIFFSHRSSGVSLRLPSFSPSLSESPPSLPSASFPLDFFLSYLASWRALSRASGSTRVGELEEPLAAASFAEATPPSIRMGSTAAAVIARPRLVHEARTRSRIGLRA